MYLAGEGDITILQSDFDPAYSWAKFEIANRDSQIVWEPDGVDQRWNRTKFLEVSQRRFVMYCQNVRLNCFLFEQLLHRPFPLFSRKSCFLKLWTSMDATCADRRPLPTPLRPSVCTSKQMASKITSGANVISRLEQCLRETVLQVPEHPKHPTSRLMSGSQC